MANFYFDSDEKKHKSFVLPGARPHYNPDKPGQVKHIYLDLSLDIANCRLEGICYITLQPIRKTIEKLTLDAVDLKIDSVLIDEVAQPFNYDGKQLEINLLQPNVKTAIKIAITYSVSHPQRGIYFIKPDALYPNKPIQVWTQGEDEDSRFWFPCFDYPGQLATSEIRIRIPEDFVAISNGELINSEVVGTDKIYHWLQKQVHPTYLMTLAVGKFAEITDKYQDIPVTYYVEKGREAQAILTMSKTPRMMEFLSEKYGYGYPYSKYAQVCVDDFIFGGMENTSTTLLTDRCLLDSRAALDNRNSESLVLHELAHQWFGDLVVIKHWSHAWIKEGMATYAEVLWTEYEYGKDEAAYYLLGQTRNYLEEDSSRYRRPIVTNIYREAIELYDCHLYEKGACVYHMVRSILGDELFDLAIKTFLEDNAHNTVETIDILRAIEKATGYNLAYLFEQYVFRGGHPEFTVSYSWDADNNLALVTIKQENDLQELFDLKISLAFNYLEPELRQQTFTLHLYQSQQNFYFPLEKKPDFLSFDRNNNFLKTVSLEYPLAELKAQLQYDNDPISRIQAAQSLSKKGGLEAITALNQALTEDTFWGVRAEVARYLGIIKLEQSIIALKAGLQDKDARVRRATIEALSEFSSATVYEILKQSLIQGDASYYTEAASARCLGNMVTANFPERETEVIDLLQEVLQERSGWNEIVRAGAIGGLSKFKNSALAVDKILEYTKAGIPQALRLAAIRALGAVSLGQNNEKMSVILSQLEELAQESFFLTQVAVVSALGQMENAKAIDILNNLMAQTPDGRVRRRAEEARDKVKKNLGSDKAIKNVQQELDKLKQENEDLKSRLLKLEAIQEKLN